MSDKIEKLIKMANDISDFFSFEPDQQLAAEGVKKHLLRAWEPRMRQEIIEYLHSGGEGLSPLALQAIKML